MRRAVAVSFFSCSLRALTWSSRCLVSSSWRSKPSASSCSSSSGLTSIPRFSSISRLSRNKSARSRSSMSLFRRSFSRRSLSRLRRSSSSASFRVRSIAANRLASFSASAALRSCSVLRSSMTAFRPSSASWSDTALFLASSIAAYRRTRPGSAEPSTVSPSMTLIILIAVASCRDMAPSCWRMALVAKRAVSKRIHFRWWSKRTPKARVLSASSAICSTSAMDAKPTTFSTSSTRITSYTRPSCSSKRYMATLRMGAAYSSKTWCCEINSKTGASLPASCSGAISPSRTSKRPLSWSWHRSNTCLDWSSASKVFRRAGLE
mmetsp:Transcript_19185/g.47097  ORF Transcript_19185/g.47097 Transcript_19185/m.47097 type:complete len:321 (-) Transcript_19185:1225-2187(-)